MNLSNFLLMTFVNALICILIPRIVTLNWSEIIGNEKPQQISAKVEPSSNVEEKATA